MEKLAIDSLKLVVLFAVEAANTVDKAAHAEGVAAKAASVLMLTDELMTLPQVKWAEVIPQIKDLDEAEKAELHEAIKAKFDIQNDKLEHVIESAVGLMLKAEALVKEAIALAQALKS